MPRWKLSPNPEGRKMAPDLSSLLVCHWPNRGHSQAWEETQSPGAPSGQGCYMMFGV